MSQRDPVLERSLPSAPETERAILGAIILDNALIDQAVQFLDAETGVDFYVPSYRKVFIAMVVLYRVGMEINAIILAEELRRNNELESVGGVLFLANLTYGLPHVTSIVQFCKVIKGKSLLRHLVKTANKIMVEALEEEDAPNTILEHAEQAIFVLRDARASEGRTICSMKEAAIKSRAHLTNLNSGSDTTIATPWEHLNNACRGGLNPTELWGLIAVQKHGKSAMAKQLADFAARSGHRALIFSREMSVLKIFYRLLAPITGIPASQVRYGLDDGRIERSIAATKQVEDLGIFIDDYTSAIEAVRTKTREMVRLEGVDLVIADYTNQFSASTRKGSNRAEEVATIWRGLKNISQEFGIATLALSHPTSESFEKPNFKKQDGRVAPYFHQSAESREAAKAVDVGLVLWTELGAGEPGARPATLYIDYQRDEDAGGQVPLVFNGRIMEFHETYERAAAHEQRY